MFIIDLYNSLEVNLRRGYRVFFIWILTLMLLVAYYADAYSNCPLCNEVFLKNLLVFLFLYSFLMIVLIIGHVMLFMMNYNKPKPVVDDGNEPYNVYSRENFINKKK